MSLAHAQFLVEQFHRKFGIPVLAKPTVPDWDRIALRKKLIKEESIETLSALTVRDLPGVADGLCDLIYVCLGAALELGIDLEPLFAVVHQANMRKEGGPTREDGKILKPEGWEPPDIAGELRKQGWEP